MQKTKPMQNPVCSKTLSLRVAPQFIYALTMMALGTAPLLALPSVSEAQVSITLGAQEVYDDNVFLESGERRPSFVIVDDQFETDFADGEVPTVLSDQQDGNENDDFITNLTISLSGSSPYFRKYMENRFQLGAGVILFSEFDSQNRLTLDGVLETSASKNVLPDPYYASIANQFSSNASDNVSFAEGTASRTAQTYSLSGRLGAANVAIAPQLNWGLGYTGVYHKFLGELRFEEATAGELEEEGSDYHTHTIGTNLDYRASRTVTLGWAADAGAQYFTSVETNDIDRETRESEDLDRINYTTRATVRYSPSQSLQIASFAGVSIADYIDSPDSREFTLINENGDTETILVERDESEANFIFGGDVAYSFSPGTQVVLGVDQNVGTDLDGDRITTRSIFSNAAIAISDRLSFNAGARFLEFSSSDELDDATERLELSSSFSYLVTQQASLVLGYSYADQRTDDPLSESALFTRSQEYKVNRVFIGINVGILGLPG